jgi:carbonic anhydrase
MCDRLTTCIMVLALLLLPAEGPAQQAAPVSGGWRTPWNYDGPKGAEHWGSLDPAYGLCSSGREQSPIDIRITTKAAFPPSDSPTRKGRSESSTTATQPCA